MIDYETLTRSQKGVAGRLCRSDITQWQTTLLLDEWAGGFPDGHCESDAVRFVKIMNSPTLQVFGLKKATFSQKYVRNESIQFHSKSTQFNSESIQFYSESTQLRSKSIQFHSVH